MMVPLIRVLQANFPKASLTWIISRPAYDIVEGMDGIEFIVIDKPNSLSDYWRFKQRIKTKSFDVLLATHSCLRANLLYPLIKAARKIGFDSLRAKDLHSWFINETIQPGHDHTLDSFLKFADVLHAEKKDIRWDIPIPATCKDWARAHLPATDDPIALVNPAASKSERSWSAERYIEVIRHLQSKWRAQIVLTGGPGRHDQTLGHAIADKIPTVINLIGKTKPKQLLALIEQADLLLCPDTGPSHMATAVGTPVVALHAVTSADVSGPYLFRHLAVDCYPEAVQTILNKTTETNVWGTHAHGENTMALVKVESVIATVDRLLSSLFKS
jgi:heptosyltransferase I